MKRILFVLTLACISSFDTASAQVVSPDARGSYGEGSLERIGSNDEKVLPDYGGGNQNHFSYDSLFSPQEEYNMLKNIVRRSASGGSGNVRAAVQGGTQPYSRINNMRIVTARR